MFAGKYNEMEEELDWTWIYENYIKIDGHVDNLMEWLYVVMKRRAKDGKNERFGCRRFTNKQITNDNDDDDDDDDDDDVQSMDENKIRTDKQCIEVYT